jgi:hypothetical protein
VVLLDGAVLGDRTSVDEDGDLVGAHPDRVEEIGVGLPRDVELVDLAADDFEGVVHGLCSGVPGFETVDRDQAGAPSSAGVAGDSGALFSAPRIGES